MSTSAISEAPPRAATLLAGIWAGALLAIGGIAAPAAFATVAANMAGRVNGRIFAIEAQVGLGVAIALVLLLRSHTKQAARRGSASLFSANMLLVLAAVFCTVAGYFALQPMMEAARAGQGAFSFGMLHGLSAGFFVIKTLLVLVLAWRLAGR